MRTNLFAITTLRLARSACSPPASQDGPTTRAEPAETAVVVDGAAGATASYEAPAANSMATQYESELLPNTRQLITTGKRSGEGYFSADGNRLIYQAELEGDNPFYQIFVRDLLTGQTTRVSPGIGLTTCAWIHPLEAKLLFAATHGDPNAIEQQDPDIAMLLSAEPRAYALDYSEHYQLY